MKISPEYQEMQREMHRNIPEYGVTARMYGQMVGTIIEAEEIDSLLDYGAGHNLSLLDTLKPNRKFTYRPYDPGVPEHSDEPEPAQMVTCIDVLEHIEPDCLDDVLDHLEDLTEQVLFATVHTGPAAKTLPDGRNAHLIQQEVEWWLPKFWERFFLFSMSRRTSSGFEVICLARDRDEEDLCGV